MCGFVHYSSLTQDKLLEKDTLYDEKMNFFSHFLSDLQPELWDRSLAVSERTQFNPKKQFPVGL